MRGSNLLLSRTSAPATGVTSSMTIRRYPPDRLDEALALGRAMHGESRFRQLDFSAQRVAALLARPNVFCAFSIAGNGATTGFFLGVAQPLWFSGELHGFDLALYLKPEHRNRRTRDAVRLVQAFEQFCREQGCAEINLGSTAEIAPESARRLYAALGYQECGFITQKGLRPCA